MTVCLWRRGNGGSRLLTCLAIKSREGHAASLALVALVRTPHVECLVEPLKLREPLKLFELFALLEMPNLSNRSSLTSCSNLSRIDRPFPTMRASCSPH